MFIPFRNVRIADLKSQAQLRYATSLARLQHHVKQTDRETVNRCIRDAGLSPIHNVRRVVKVEEIPLLGTGKTDYRALKARLG